MPRIFISYSHDSEEHKNRVHDLASRIRAIEGLQVIIDRDKLPAGPSEGWTLWSEAQVRDADKLLIACTEPYYRRYEGLEKPGIGLGSVCEAQAIRQLLYNTGGINQKFRVVMLAEGDSHHIPLQLQKYHRYALYRPNAYEEMIAWLSGHSPALTISEPSVAIPWPTSIADYQWTLADRQEIFQAFEKTITGQSTSRVLLISGSSNNGKTVLMSELHAYVKQLNTDSVLVDFKGCPSMDDLFQSLRLDLGSAILRNAYKSSGTARFHDLIADFQQLAKPLSLIFDTYEQASADTQKWIESQLLLRLDRIPAIVVVIGGQTVPDHNKYAWRRLADVHELGPIEQPEHWMAYIHRKWNNPSAVTLDQVQTLTMATDGQPGILSALIDNMVGRSRKGAGAR